MTIDCNGGSRIVENIRVMQNNHTRRERQGVCLAADACIEACTAVTAIGMTQMFFDVRKRYDADRFGQTNREVSEPTDEPRAQNVTLP